MTRRVRPHRRQPPLTSDEVLFCVPCAVHNLREKTKSSKSKKSMPAAVIEIRGYASPASRMLVLVSPNGHRVRIWHCWVYVCLVEPYSQSIAFGSFRITWHRMRWNLQALVGTGGTLLLAEVNPSKISQRWLDQSDAKLRQIGESCVALAHKCQCIWCQVTPNSQKLPYQCCRP